jgi:hypothetical protein
MEGTWGLSLIYPPYASPFGGDNHRQFDQKWAYLAANAVRNACRWRDIVMQERVKLLHKKYMEVIQQLINTTVLFLRYCEPQLPKRELLR